MHTRPRRALAIATVVASCLLTSVARADTGSDDGEWLPSFRAVGGATVYPDGGGLTGAFELTAGARLQLGEDGWSGVGVSGELGWAYLAGALPEANYLSVTLGVDLGGALVQVGLFGTFLVGDGANTTSLGGRACLRGELLLGIVGIEIGYEARLLADAVQHGVRIAGAVDLGVLFYYAFGLAGHLSRVL